MNHQPDPPPKRRARPVARMYWLTVGRHFDASAAAMRQFCPDCAKPSNKSRRRVAMNHPRAGRPGTAGGRPRGPAPDHAPTVTNAGTKSSAASRFDRAARQACRARPTTRGKKAALCRGSHPIARRACSDRRCLLTPTRRCGELRPSRGGDHGSRFRASSLHHHAEAWLPASGARSRRLQAGRPRRGADRPRGDGEPGQAADAGARFRSTPTDRSWSACRRKRS